MTAGRGLGGHQSARSGTDTWLTPPEIVAALGRFELNPCAAPSPRPWPTAARHIELPEDGLAADWGRERVFLNPTYGRETWEWMGKLAEHGRGIALIFARTETAGFMRTVWQRADAVMFLYGRVRFHHTDGRPATYTGGAPSCLVSYSAEDTARLRAAAEKLNGTLVTLDQNQRAA